MYMTTGERIREARKKAGMTQAELADKLGIPYQSIGQWERDLRNPKPGTLEKIASALGINWYELYAESEKEQMEAKKNYDIAKFLSEKRKGVKVGIIGKDGKTEFRDITIDDYFELFEEDAERKKKYLSLYDQLNGLGKKKAIERVEELTEIPKYRKQATTDEK